MGRSASAESLILPNVLICGASKSGTTSLYGFFQEHPDVMTATRKEVHFFDQEKRFAQGLRFYSSFFVGYAGQKAILDATPTYLYFPQVADRILKTLGPVPLIFIFRNPAHRAYSHYWMAYRNGTPMPPFRSAIRHPDFRYLLSMGRYRAMLEPFLKLFPRERLLFLIMDELTRDPQGIRRRCYQHAGIDPDFRPKVIENKRNASTMPRSLTLQRLAYRFILARAKPEDRFEYKDGLLTRDLAPRSGFLDRIRNRAFHLLIRCNMRAAQYPPMDKDDERHLLEEFRPDLEDFSQQTGLDVSSWLKEP